jgi:hypothetical protein
LDEINPFFDHPLGMAINDSALRLNVDKWITSATQRIGKHRVKMPNGRVKWGDDRLKWEEMNASLR